MNKEAIQSVKNLVFKGSLKQAISKTKELLDSIKNSPLVANDYSSLENTLLLISSQFENFIKDERNRTKKQEYISNERNQITLTLLKFINEIEQVLSSENIDISSSLLHLKVIDPDEGMKLATEAIKKSSSIRIIGAGRQDIAEDSTNSNVSNYYEKIQNRLSEKSKESQPVLIKRITQHVLKDKFQSHLKKCFDITAEPFNVNRFEMVLYGKLKIAYTYVIIDSNKNNESIIFLNLHTKNYDQDIVDTSLVFTSKDKNIISIFKTHFDQFWEKESKRGRVIKSIEDFDNYIPFDEQLYKEYNEIKYFIKRVPNKSIRMSHLKYEIALFHKRLKGVDNCKLMIPHTKKNQRLSQCFYWYVSQLKKGMSYKTISFDEFWYCLYDIEKFLEKQEIALIEGATIERIYLINTRRIEEKEYFDDQQKIIYKNIIHHHKYDKYTFSILFTKDENELKRRRNFAIWSDDNKDYQVVFLLNYGQKEPQTTVYFVNRPKSKRVSKVPHDNEQYLSNAIEKFNIGKQLVSLQNETLLEYIAKDANSSEFEKKISFLKKCGIPNIESYLRSCP